MASAVPLIKEEEVQNVRQFEWLALKLASGFAQGKHHSIRLGTGNEFQQYRSYVPGDDVRSIDWKMYAKTEKFYIKQAAIETEHKFHFVVDNTHSMLYEEAGRSKLFISKLLTAAMMRIASVQGDSFRWSSQGELGIERGRGERHWKYAVESLYQLGPATGNIDASTERIDGSTIWLSDFYLSTQEIEEKIKRLKTQNSELFCFHILGIAEKNLDFARNSTFQDLETGLKLDVNTSAIVEEYREKLITHIHEFKNIILDYGGVYTQVSINDSVSITLRSFFHLLQYNLV